jgi:hypothetical protein
VALDHSGDSHSSGTDRDHGRRRGGQLTTGEAAGKLSDYAEHGRVASHGLGAEPRSTESSIATDVDRPPL